MHKLSAIRKSIISRIHSFCEDLIAGNLPKEIGDKYNIPAEYIAVCKDSVHPSSKKLNDRLFMYVMEKTGYYNASQDSHRIEELQRNIDTILEKGGDDREHNPIIMHPFKLGIKTALDSIVSLTDSTDIDFAEKNLLSDVVFSKEKGCFILNFKKPYTREASIESVIGSINQITIEGKSFDVLKGGLTLRSRKINFTHPDEITLVLNKFQSASLRESSKFYFRYITEIEKKDDIFRLFGWHLFDVEGHDTHVIETIVNGHQLLFYEFQFQGKNFLIIDYYGQVTSKEMLDLCFATLVSFGMITCTVHLNDGWLVAYDTPEMQSATGVLYRTWIPTVHCDYEIFTTNVYSRLIPVAERHDPVMGEGRMIKLIQHYECANKLLPFSPEVFGHLIENMAKYEELQRGIFIILMGSHYNLEVQAAIYCVAMEAITNLGKQIMGPWKETIVDDKKVWRKIYNGMNSTLTQLYKEGIVNESEYKDFGKKVNDLNRNFNSEKLKALLEHYKYPLTDFDNLTLCLRNPLLHGTIIFDKLKYAPEEDNLFQLSLNLHKLCCATALLMSGFEGYIVNNRNYYGYPKSGTAFIKIGTP